MSKYTHIFFDFFGTLVRYSKSHRGEDHKGSYSLLVDKGCALTYGAYLDEWEATFERFVHPANQSLDEFSMDELCDSFLRTVLPADAGPDIAAEFRDAYLDEWSRGVEYIPRLDRMLDELAARYALAVVSNTHHERLVRDHLHAAGITDCFSAIVTSVEHGRRKPCPTIYRRALSVTRGRADATLFVGDSLADDYLGPRRGGLGALLIDPAASEPIPEEHRLRDVLDVPARLGT